MARPSKLASLSNADLQAELRRRQGTTGKLQRKRAILVKKLAAIDNAIRAMGGSVTSIGFGGSKTGRTRPTNKLTLIEALQQTLDGKTLSVTDACEAVQKAGYNTNSPNFRTIVNQALLAHKNKFKKVARGQYTAAK